MEAADRRKLHFMLVTDRHATKRPLNQVVEAALEGGFRAVQLREKDLGAGELYQLARPLRELTRRYHALLIINDRLDVALAVGADGVHLGWRSLSPKVAHAVANNGLIIGASTHNIVEVRKALREKADYIIFGPVFPTPSKAGRVETVGLEQLRIMAVPSPVPVLGIGGINAQNVAEVFGARASGVAVLRGLMAAEDVGATAKAIVAHGTPAIHAAADKEIVT